MLWWKRLSPRFANDPPALRRLVQVDFDAACDGQPLAEIAPKAAGLGQARDYWIRADERAFLPELGDALVGTSVGDQKEIGVDFAQDFSLPELAGKHAVYTVSIKAVREPKLPELNESFVKGLGVETAEQFRERVRERLQQSAEASEQRQRRDQIVRYLLEKTQIDVPESLVQAQTRSTVYDLVRHNRMRGISQEEIESHRDEIFGAAAQSAVETVKLRHILRRVAAEESLEASEGSVPIWSSMNCSMTCRMIFAGGRPWIGCCSRRRSAWKKERRHE